MGAADCTTRSNIAHYARTGSPAFQFSTADVTPLSDIMPVTIPAFSFTPTSTKDAFIGYSSLSITDLDEYLDLFVNAMNSRAIAPRKGMELLTTITGVMRQDEPEYSPYGGRTGQPINTFLATADLEAGFAAQLVAWKAAMKRISKEVGYNPSDSGEVINSAFEFLESEFRWQINDNTTADMAGYSDDEVDDGFHLTFERMHPAMFFELENMPSAVMDLLMSGYMGISGDTEMILEMMSDAIDSEVAHKLNSDKLLSIISEPMISDWLQSDSLKKLLDDEPDEEEELAQRYDLLAKPLRNGDMDRALFIELIKEWVVDKQVGSAFTLFEACASAHMGKLNPTDCLNALVNSECPKERFFAKAAEFIDQRAKSNQNRYLDFNPTYAHPSSNLFISLEGADFGNSAINYIAADFATETQYSADNTCGNCGDGERGVGLVLDLKKPVSITKANEEAILETKETFLMFLAIALWA